MELEHTRHWKRNVAMMVLSQILVMSGFCAAMPFIPLFLKEGLGILNTGERGLYLSMFNFFGMLAYSIFNLHPAVTVRKDDSAAVLEHRGQVVRIFFPGEFEIRDSRSYQDFTKIPGRQLIFRTSGAGGKFQTRIQWDREA